MAVLNILDYSPVDEGLTTADALRQTVEPAKLAEQLGYHRFWVAEHHQVLSVAGSSPEMLMMQLAASTEHIRIGSGGVMLPHYSAYKVAENFRLLEALHPGRIDLGIGRSRSYRLVNEALNEEKGERLSYEQQLDDLKKFFSDDLTSEHRFQRLVATPVINTTPEMWLLGTGMGSAKLAAAKGMAYAYAHFAKPSKAGVDVIDAYRSAFVPSESRQEPKTTIAVFAIVGETAEQAEQIAQALDLWLLFVESDAPPPYYPSVETALNRGFSRTEQEKVARNRDRMIVGDAQHVKAEIERIRELYGADEITLIPNVAGAENRKNVLRLLADAFQLAAQ